MPTAGGSEKAGVERFAQPPGMNAGLGVMRPSAARASLGARSRQLARSV